MKKRFALLGVAALLVFLCGPALTAHADMPEGPPLYETCNNGINAAPETEEPINEHCEDYNDVEMDDCLSNCKLNECGDGILHMYSSDTDPNNNIPDAQFAKGPMPLEACDDGNTQPGDGCSPTCGIEADCGNGVLNPGEACDDNNLTDGDGCNKFCMIEGEEDGQCGDEETDEEMGEECDDGNLVASDDCDSCHRPRCGDGIPNGIEECDDGNTLNFDDCSNNCTLLECGDGILNGGEACDSGGECLYSLARCTTLTEATDCMGGDDICTTDDGDACSPNCDSLSVMTTCGDGLKDSNEQCDDGGECVGGDNEGAACTTLTELGVCTDGGTCVPQSGDGCSATCMIEYCGDGVVNEDEPLDTLLFGTNIYAEDDLGLDECDDGNFNPFDSCDTMRLYYSYSTLYFMDDRCDMPYCGNGDLEAGEECDDDNNDDGDGCSADCLIETGPYCGDGVVDEGEECDDGNKENHDICRDNCEYNVEAVESGIICGDGVVMAPEECDDGNTVDGDGCTNSCARECAEGAVDDSGACTDYVPLPSDALLPVFAEAGATTDTSVNGDTTGGDSTTDTEATGTGGGDGTLDGAGADADGDSDGGCALIPTAMPTTAGLSLLLLGLGSLAAVRRRR